MKILQLIQKPQLRGAEIFACQLATELITKGNEVHIAYLYSDRQELAQKFPNLRFIDLLARKSRRFYDLRAYSRINKLVRTGNYDLVQANAGDTLKYMAISRFLYKWKTPLVFRNANKMSSFITGRIHLTLTRWFLRKCDYYLSVSENCRQDLITILPDAMKKSATKTIGTYFFDHVQSIMRKNEHVIIDIGALVEEKNFDLLIDIFHLYFQKNQKGYLWIVGDGPLRERLQQKVDRLHLNDHVTFWGKQNDVIPILKAADVLVMPSKIEGLPGVILEALSTGVPVIASDVGGIPEVITDGETGFCIASGKPGDYADKIEMLMDQPALRGTLTRQGKKLIRDKYLMEVIADEFMDAFAKIIANKQVEV